jgi:hypothetical protein
MYVAQQNAKAHDMNLFEFTLYAALKSKEVNRSEKDNMVYRNHGAQVIENMANNKF